MSKALSSLSVGDKIEVPVLSAYQSRFGAKIVFKVADKNHSGYPANSVTLIAEKIIHLMASDAKEPSSSDSNRKQYGNNRHIHSNLLQWLNSNATAGNWYSAKHSADQAPTTKSTHVTYNPYTAWAGFLAMLDPKFVAELLTTTLTVVKSSTDGGSYETFNAKMFLASTTEVGLANENSIAEGSRLALFSNDASRVAYPTAECVSNADGYTSSNFATTKGWYWWLRTPNFSHAFNVRIVGTGGSLSNDGACGGYRGVRPLCNLKSSILVSDTTNSAGNYTIIYNSAPTAPSGITAPATAYSGNNINISCAAATDPDGDASPAPSRSDVLLRAFIQQRSVDASSSVRVADVYGSGIDGVEYVKIPRPRERQLRQLFRVHHQRRYCRNSQSAARDFRKQCEFRDEGGGLHL